MIEYQHTCHLASPSVSTLRHCGAFVKTKRHWFIRRLWLYSVFTNSFFCSRIPSIYHIVFSIFVCCFKLMYIEKHLEGYRQKY